ncbi:MAG: GntR family transcriptional regulator [Clostridiales bacterium]|nr:GntR family transcriptional regulator [Clostridiales bacterium]
MAKNKPLRQTAYEYIKAKILSCEYAPGTYINEHQICEEMDGISRTPVRDALGRLEQEGLLEIMPKKGILVTALNFSDINRLYEVRLLLEPYVLRRYGAKLDPVELNRFAEIMADPGRIHSDSAQYYFYDLDDQFHGFIMNALPNQYLLGAYDNISNLNHRLRVLSGNVVENRIRDTFAEHLLIINACLAEDWEAAASAMTEHLENSRVATFHLISASGYNV